MSTGFSIITAVIIAIMLALLSGVLADQVLIRFGLMEKCSSIESCSSTLFIWWLVLLVFTVYFALIYQYLKSHKLNVNNKLFVVFILAVIFVVAAIFYIFLLPVL